ncbi:hypothetical protein, partial [Rhodovulum sulfidophilum]|uniref:hypothetical protein n=1 Tax=Rhodovulum sulfidophilum TaxID=35806 RepID=UPI001F1A15EE
MPNYVSFNNRLIGNEKSLSDSLAVFAFFKHAVRLTFAADGHFCRTLAVRDSHYESMRLDGSHEQAQARALPHDELVRLSSHRGAIRFEPDG